MPRLVPVCSPSVPAPAGHGSWRHHPSSSRSCSRASSSACSASSTHSGLPVHRLTGRGQVPVISLCRGNAHGLVRLPICRLRLHHGLFLSCVRYWTRSRLRILLFWPEPHSTGSLFWFLCPTQVPVFIPCALLCLVAIVHGLVVIPALIGRLLLVWVLRGRGCGGSHLIGLTVHCCRLGHLPGVGLLLLVIRDVALVLHLGVWTRIVRGSSPR